MADGNLVRQSNVGKGSVVFGPSVYDVPLLPYEKELIKTIGLTEEEYRKFAAEVRRRGMVRPAAYDHIPDVQAGQAAVPILINLAISLVLTGVAYLLTPKPKMPRAKGGGTVDLGDITGPSRFTPSRGFETLAELADYQSAIPLIFGRYDATEKVGGMLVTPKLVWSRMFSYGPMQQAKLMFVVGEQGIGSEGIGAPEESGIFLGNNALDAVYDDFYAFYWKNVKRGQSEVGIVNGDLAHGQAGPEIVNKKAGKDEVFVCPSSDEDNVVNFCHAYSPTNNTEFGVYAPIANGTGYRLNYEVVNAGDNLDDKNLRQAVITRIKIAGCKNKVDGAGELDDKKDSDEIRDTGQDSFGRNYSPRMGIVSVKTSAGTVKASANELQKDVDVEVGDTAIFLISHEVIPEKFYKRGGKGESVEDINSTVQSMQFAADDAMQPGEVFAIGGTVWKVTKRSLTDNRRFDPDFLNEDQEITLECIDIKNALDNTIGVVSRDKVINPSKNYVGDSFEDSGRQTISEVFFPITKVATGIVRNNRPAIVTEIGIKSTVFQRLNGLCAFNSLPTPSEIDDFQRSDLQVRTGTITSAIPRVSVFQVLIRRAGTDDEFEAVRGAKSDGGLMLFAVRGSTPIAQYNFIRFVLPEPQELEFKFAPISGAELRRTSRNKTLIDLSHAPSSKPNSFLRLSTSIPGFGELEVDVSGKEILRTEVTRNKEFFRELTTIQEPDVTRYPSEVSKSETLPAAQKGSSAEAIVKVSNAGIANISTTQGKAGAFAYALLEEAGIGEKKREKVEPDGLLKSVVTRELVGGRWIELKWFFSKLVLGSTHYARQNGIEWSWFVERVEVVGSFPSFTDGEIIEIKRGAQSTNADYPAANYSNSNPFKANNPGGTLRWSGLKFRVSVGDSVKINGRIQAYKYELFGDADSFEKGETKSTIISLEGDNSSAQQIRLKLTSSVVDSEDDSFGQAQDWSKPSIEIRTGSASNTTQNWAIGDTARDVRTISANNPYKTVYDEAGAVYVIGNVDFEKTREVVEGEAVFAPSTQLSDISHYRNLVEKSNATTPEHEIVYVNEIQENAQDPTFKDLTLAGLSLKAGRQFTALDQLRVWLGNGIQVERLHESVQQSPVNTQVALDVYGTTEKKGPSNLFSDLVFYLLTDQVGGAGALLGMTRKDAPLVDKNELSKTSSFLHKQKLFFNGAVTDRTNLRQFIADVAPYFLCNFIVSNGKFSLKPALPVMPKSEEVNTGPVVVEQIFTEGNILEDTYKVEYLGAEERRPFQAVVRYRQEKKNRLPEEKTITVRARGSEYNRSNVDILPIEQFDLTQFCTSEHHALLVAKYFLSLRQLVTHTISFSTTLEGLDIQAGSFIKVVTKASPYNSANTGTIDSNGNVTSVRELPSGQYVVDYFATDSDDIERDTMEVTNGVVTATQFHSSVFTLVNETVSQNIYVVEQLTFSQEGTVDIVASEHPCDDKDRSLLVDSIYNGSYTEKR